MPRALHRIDGEARPRDSAPPGRGFSRLFSIAVGSVAAGAVVLSLWVIRQERIVADGDTRLARQSDVLRRGDDYPFPPLPRLPAFAPARARLSNALYNARAAVGAKVPARRERLMQARADADQASQARPRWGEAWIVKAFIIDMLNDGRFSPAQRDAISRSYYDQPFLADAGRWRVEIGLEYWERFPPRVRDRIVDETVWLLQATPPEERAPLFAMARGSRAYRAVFLRWREVFMQWWLVQPRP